MRVKDKFTWVIKLPTKAKLLVKVGDKVDVGDNLAVFNSHKVETFDYSGSLTKMNDEQREELNKMFKEKPVKVGEVFYNLGVFKNKICFPLTGLCLGFDEFKNLRVEKEESEKKEIFAPVKAKVSKIEEEKIVLEFRAKEYEGEGLNGLKAWGEGEIKIIDDIKFVNYELNKNVFFTKKFDKTLLLKAEVVGVKAIVILDKEEVKGLDINLPVLRLKEKIWNVFMKENKGEEKRMLVNAKMNRLLLVLE
jgi:hypothetical protein